ncbi:MAG: hypothetical protein MSA17_06025, partial [Collinsella sp.]|nr:hypothetical protein [Collinsella sp.]
MFGATVLVPVLTGLS